MKKRKPKYTLLLTVCIAAMIATVTAAVLFIRSLNSVALNERIKYIKELSSQGTNAITTQLNNDLSEVNAVARYIEGTGDPFDTENIVNGIHNVFVNSRFDNLAVADASGNMYHTVNNTPINISDRSYFPDIMEGKNIISDILDARDDGISCIVIASPIRSGDKITGAVVARYPSEVTDALLDRTVSDKDAFCYMCYPDGKVFGAKTPSREYEDVKRMTNVIYDLQNDSRYNYSAMFDIKNDIAAGKSGVSDVVYMDRDYLISYEPTYLDDLYCIVMIPDDKPVTDIQNTVYLLIFGCAAGFILVISLLIYIILVNRRLRIENERAENDLQLLYKSVPGGIFRCSRDPSLRVMSANEYFYALIEMNRTEFDEECDNNIARLITDGAEEISRQPEDGSVMSFEKNIVCGSGNVKQVLIAVCAAQEDSGEPSLFCTMTDVSMTNKLYNELHMHEKRCSLIIDQADDMIFEWDCDKNKISYSHKFSETFKYTPDISEMPDGFVSMSIVYRDDVYSFINMFKTINLGSSYSEEEIRIRRIDGGYLWCRVGLTAVRDEENRLRRIIGFITDIDKEKRESEIIMENAKLDPASQLYSSSALEDLTDSIIRADSAKKNALLLIRINGLAEVASSCGTEAADKTISELSDRLRALFRDTDIIGRAGDNTIAVFMTDITGEQIADYKAKCVVEAFDYTVQNDGGISVSVSANIGIVFAPKEGNKYSDLYIKADKALQRIKNDKNTHISVYGHKKNKK